MTHDPPPEIITAFVHTDVTDPRAYPVWQPIATAPTDGTVILVWATGECVIAYWPPSSEEWQLEGEPPEAGWWSLHADVDVEIEPTHWMPLPEPPPGVY